MQPEARLFHNVVTGGPYFYSFNASIRHPRRANLLVARNRVEKSSGAKEEQLDTLEDAFSNVVEGMVKVDKNVECVGTGMEVECVIQPAEDLQPVEEDLVPEDTEGWGIEAKAADLALLISPFFFWGTSMAVMKVVVPHTSPLFVGAFRLLPAGAVLILWAALTGRQQPQSIGAWAAISIFGIVDGTLFQGFLAEGLQRTSAGLGSVIIDSQPITVALLASLLYDEALSPTIVVGMGLGLFGLGLLEVPSEVLTGGPSQVLNAVNGLQMTSLWDNGEWWMLLAAQSMAVGTVMVRWVSKFCDPVMATGWHMVIGSIPLIVLCSVRESSILFPHLANFTGMDALALVYIALLGSAASYGVFFYNASKGNLTTLSSLTFLTPVFATAAGYFALGENLTPVQFLGAFITLLGVFCVNGTEGDGEKA